MNSSFFRDQDFTKSQNTKYEWSEINLNSILLKLLPSYQNLFGKYIFANRKGSAINLWNYLIFLNSPLILKLKY